MRNEQIEYNKLSSIGILKRLDKLYGVKKEFKVSCNKCGKTIKVIERDKQHPRKGKYFCSRAYANGHTHTDVSKKQTLSIWQVWD